MRLEMEKLDVTYKVDVTLGYIVVMCIYKHLGILFALPVIVVHVLVTEQLPTVTNSTSSLSSNQTTSSYGGSGETTASPKQFCREQFPSQASRMGYQLFVLLSTYVLPFVAIIIMNSMIVYKLQQRGRTIRILTVMNHWIGSSEYDKFFKPNFLKSPSKFTTISEIASKPKSAHYFETYCLSTSDMHFIEMPSMFGSSPFDFLRHSSVFMDH
ncbi:hypothetical protein T265_01233 [Opisthorchis viverrini]|uniref:G-protein coupled receptors family 1 profile domain-containing protein n=1 Tax=Opisthorchis viverrini TaxID=6198 RepID=A0A075A084_OPIVI|nr:hypothetical protein T265_01233 [Opisthorchis viverrini]KER32746.1 hypothetical protein T265_01233 [Opisthorchis viverrini]